MYLLLVLSLINSIQEANLQLDEPPCWCNFRIESSNKLYYSEISRDITDSLKKPWESKWIIETFKVDSGTIKKIWESDYFYDGYPEGILSNDGKVYAYVNEWFFEEKGIVKVYNVGNLIADIQGIEFDILKSSLINTVSHKLWLSNEIYPNYEFIYLEDDSSINLSVGFPQI